MTTILAPDGQPVEAPKDFRTRVLSTATAMYHAAETTLPDMTLDEFLNACLLMYTNGMCEHGGSVALATSRARLGIKRMWPGVSEAVKQQKFFEWRAKQQKESEKK